jgi:aspartyl-tRNA(Asn)/glutamyl-tRNA(Gln) amidotransferase subunit A
MMLSVIAGFDQLDPTTVNVRVPDYTGALKMEISKLRLGVPRTPFFDSLDSEVAKAVEQTIEDLRKITGSLIEATLPPAPSVMPIVGAEAYAYHSKWITASPERYQSVTRERIIGSSDAKASAYSELLRQTNLLRREITKEFSRVDLLITPTMPRPAETFAQSKNFDPLGIRNTSPFDIFGLPTISVPCGFTRSGLPIGLQVSGAPVAESTVLALAHAYERETEWHRRRPELTPA